MVIKCKKNLYIVYFLFQKARNPFFIYHFNAAEQTMEKEKTDLLYLIWQWVFWKANAIGKYVFCQKQNPDYVEN